MPNTDSTDGKPLEELPRVLGLFDAVTVVVGSIIGSGIFLSKVGRVAEYLHSFGPIIAIWIGVGGVTLCGSLALAELAAMYPRAGGPYLYLREAYGKLPAFLWGWTEFWVVRTGSVGALACATVIYFNRLIPIEPFLQAVLAVAIVLGLSAINYFSTRWGATVQNATAVIKLAFLAGIICLPLLLGKTSVANAEPIWPSPEPGLLKAIGLAMIAVLWPYDGWINIAPVAEEIRDPQRNVPRGLALGMLIVILVYVGANISYHLALPMSYLSGIDPATGAKIGSPANEVAFDLFGALFGDMGGKIAALGVMCSTFGAVNSNMLTGPRIYFAMARDGLLPASIHKVHEQHRTPGNAIIIQAVWTTILLVLFYSWKANPREAFDGLTDTVIFGGLPFYALSVAAVYVLRRRRPDAVRPYRTWGYPVTPALLIGAYAGVIVSELGARPEETAGVGALIAAGVVYFWFVRGRARSV